MDVKDNGTVSGVVREMTVLQLLYCASDNNSYTYFKEFIFYVVEILFTIMLQ